LTKCTMCPIRRALISPYMPSPRDMRREAILAQVGVVSLSVQGWASQPSPSADPPAIW
jgi:hypothetical protein